jgi:alkyl sulfatase BDS1-like metallo-beta-lactamase superfamily hydrolase
VAELFGHQHGQPQSRGHEVRHQFGHARQQRKFIVELSNSALTNIKGQQAAKPDLTITVNRTDLEQVMAGKASFDELIQAGKAKFEGDRKPFDQLRSTLVRFTPDFEMMPGTKSEPNKAPAVKDPMQAQELAHPAGG